MYQYTASGLPYGINNIVSYITQNQWMILLITMGVIPIAIGVYLAIREKIRTGSSEGLRSLTSFLAIPLLYIIMSAAGFLLWQIHLGNPYAIAFRVVLAVIIPAIFFGYLFAVMSNMLVTTAYLKDEWKYVNHFGRSILLILVSLWVYGLSVEPIIDIKGLSSLFLGLGVFIGWLVAPVIISRGWAGFDENIRIKVNQLDSHVEHEIS